MTSETQTEHAVQTSVVLIPLNKLKKSPKNARKTPHAKAEIEAVEDFLDIEVDHVAIVDFTGFEDLIDAVGGVVVDVPHKLCAEDRKSVV